MINKVILIGNLGKDPDVRKLDSGVSVAKFSLATNESYKDNMGEWKDITEWHNIICWRGLAESAERNLKKGMQIYIEGKLTTRKWQDTEGKDRYSTEVVANTFRRLGKREASELSGGGGFPGAQDAPPSMKSPTNQPIAEQSPAKDFSKEMPKEDDLPF